MTDTPEIPYLILHKVRGEPAFDIAHRIEVPPDGGTYIWIVSTSGHRAYPYRWWLLEDLADVSDINRSGFHDRPASLDHTVPADWPDHYGISPGQAPKPKILHSARDVLALLGFKEPRP